MYTAWTKHLKTEKEKSDFQREILSARPVLERQAQLIEEEEATIERAEGNFDNPNWDYRQAYNIGYRAGLRFSKKLIDLDQQTKENK